MSSSPALSRMCTESWEVGQPISVERGCMASHDEEVTTVEGIIITELIVFIYVSPC